MPLNRQAPLKRKQRDVHSHLMTAHLSPRAFNSTQKHYQRRSIEPNVVPRRGCFYYDRRPEMSQHIRTSPSYIMCRLVELRPKLSSVRSSDALATYRGSASLRIDFTHRTKCL